MTLDCVVRDGLLVTASETFQADIGITGERIAMIGSNLPLGAREIDARDRIVVPGCIDVHTHFSHYVEYIGSNNSDDFGSGTRAAARGGVTTVVNYAFQRHGESPRAAAEREIGHATGQSYVDFGVHLVLTDLAGETALHELPALLREGFSSLKVFTTVSGYALSDADVLRVLRAAKDLGVMVNVHAEDDALCTDLTNFYMSRGATGVEFLPKSRPPLAEALATGRVAAYANLLNTPVYFVHLSSGDALDSVRAVRARGGEIYVETRPVYLFLDDSLYDLPDGEGRKYVCLPPLRNRENQAALWAALRNGEIQTYATDHAPWTLAQKMDLSLPFPRIPAGVSNVQTSIGMLYSEGVARGRLSVNRFVELTATNPAKLFGMWPRKGTLAVGADADLVLIDPRREIEVSASWMESRADYDPYEGYRAIGWPVLTILRGQVVADDTGVANGVPRGTFVPRAPYERL